MYYNKEKKDERNMSIAKTHMVELKITKVEGVGI